jgi:flagellar basal body-associated protein FliL
VQKKSTSHTLLIVLIIVGVALLVALAFVVNRFGKPSS